MAKRKSRQVVKDKGKGPANAAVEHYDSASARKANRAFDQWLRRQLSDLYDPVLDEPIPERLVDTVQKHRQADEKKED